MPYKTTAEMLRALQEDSPLGITSMDELREAFTRFYLGFQAPQELRIAEVPIGSAKGFWIAAPGSDDRRVILFFHGGGFTIGSTRDHMELCGRLSALSGARVLSLDYRLAPEHPFPAAVDDCAAAHAWLLDQGVEKSRLALAGISAGATLVLATLLGLKERRGPLPRAAVCMSPAPDLLFPGKSVNLNRDSDWITQARLDSLRASYLAGRDPRQPLASPIYGDFTGLPPLLLQAGEADLLRDDIAALAGKARAAGVPVTFTRYPEMFHCWQIFAGQLLEGQRAVKEAGEFLRANLR